MSNEITWKLENEKVGRLLLHYAIPAVIGTMVNALYNIVDRIFIGQGVGSLAIAGLTLTFPLLILLQAFGMLIGIGAATRISIYWGRKDLEQAENVLGNALVLLILITLLTTIPALFFMEELLVLFGGSDQTIPYAKDYLYVVIPGNLFAALSFSFNAVMRASGYPKKAMFLMIIGAIANVILDPIFIFGLNMGIRGAAIATIVSMMISAFFVMRHFVEKDSLIRFRKRCFTLKFPIIWTIITIGISPFAIQVAGSLVNVVMNHTLKVHGGDLAIGANGIITSVTMLLVMLILGITQGMQPIVGFNYGAGYQKRVFDTLKLVIIASTVIMGVGWLCSLLFPETIVRAFTNDPVLVDIAANGLRISMLVSVVIGSQISITQFFQSIGVAWKAMFLSLSRQCLFLIPALLIFPPFWGLDGAWFAMPLSDLIAVIIGWSFLWHHVRKTKKQLLDL